MDEVLTLEFDGGSRGNPGPAGIGVVVRSEDGTPLVTLGRFIGKATNNVAEYRALISALQQAAALGGKRVVVRGDSELVVKQMLGQYKVRHPDLQPLHAEASALLRQFASWKIDHNFREKNQLADRLANLAMDRRAEVTDVEVGGGEGASRASETELPEPKAGDVHLCPRCRCAIEVKAPARVHGARAFVCQCGTKMGLQ